LNTWDDDDVERWLNDNPLPKDFIYNGEKVWPRYVLKHGYGQWLRTAGSYHPALRGLFRLVCDILKEVPDGSELPTPERLQAELEAHASMHGTLGLEIEPATEPTVGQGVDFSRRLKRNQPPDPAASATA
jgi:hypothetical protein